MFSPPFEQMFKVANKNWIHNTTLPNIINTIQINCNKLHNLKIPKCNRIKIHQINSLNKIN